MSWYVKDNFEDAIKTLNLSVNIVSELDREINKKLYFELLDRFVVGGDRRWWWEAFKTSFRFPKFNYPTGYINELIPDIEKHVWIMIEDDQQPFYPIYNVQASYISMILDECFGFEYYIIDKRFDWLICENHHNYLIGVGDKLKEFNKTILLEEDDSENKR